jgi:hypothetical protein
VDDGDNTNELNSSMVLMDLIARKSGRLRKGGDPCLRSAAIMLINDFQRGRLPHYVAPPELKTTPEVIAQTVEHEVTVAPQNLDEIDCIAASVEKLDQDDNINNNGRSDNISGEDNNGDVGHPIEKVEEEELTTTSVKEGQVDSGNSGASVGGTAITQLIGECNWD